MYLLLILRGILLEIILGAFSNNFRCSFADSSTHEEKVILKHVGGMIMPTMC